jgi:hypothetical protein
MRVSIFLTVLVASTLARAADARGWYDPGCGGAMFHLMGLPGQPPVQEFVLRLSTGNLAFNYYLVGPHWWDVTAQDCSKAGDCGEATKAKLQFQKIGRRHVSGEYQIDFKGQHLEGQYQVKYRHKGGPYICE